MFKATPLDIKEGTRAVFYVYTKNWQVESSGVVEFDKKRGRRVIVLDCGGMYDIWHVPYYMPYNRISQSLTKNAKLASESMWFMSGHTDKDLY